MKLTRKKKTLPNPFIVNHINMLWEDEYRPGWLDDLLIGTIRAFRADEPTTGSTRKEVCSVNSIYKIFRQTGEITRESIQSVLQCSNSQVTRCINVVKLVTPFLAERLLQDLYERPVEQPPTDGLDYIDFRDPASDFALGRVA